MEKVVTGSDLAWVAFDPELSIGARNAVRTCLRIQPAEKVTLITDHASLEIGASLFHEVRQVTPRCTAFILEDYAPRPLEKLPEPILEDLESSQVSLFAANAQTNELKSRMQMTRVVHRHRIRHAHMVNINHRIMLEGMRADYNQVDAVSTKVCELARGASVVRARTAAGTDLTVRLNPEYRWIKTSGIIQPEKWGNLPGGEVFTTPDEVNGTYVIDGVVGDYLCDKYGLLRQQPLTVRIRENRLTEVFSENKALEQEFWKYCHTDENSDRVGEFAIGTNIAVGEVIGHILQDEKVPGVHIAFGNPYGEHTGAEWTSSSHIDVVGSRFDTWLDDRQIMQSGQFLL